MMRRIADGEAPVGSYDLVVIGSGFGSSFFLAEALERGAKSVLVIERGRFHDHEWQVANKKNSAVDWKTTFSSQDKKTWRYNIGFGGGSMCWYGQTPRLHPSDFQLKTKYGVGVDWPISYNDLEPYYGRAEKLMSISGDPAMGRVLPRSTPFPQPPHNPSGPDRLMKAAQPDRHFIMPTARARLPVEGQRSSCCASSHCWLCPVDAKFTILNGMQKVYDDPRVTVWLGARVLALETQGSSATAVEVESGGRRHRIPAETVVLGANAIHSAHILLASGVTDGPVGRNLHEQLGVQYEVLLNGTDNFDGSTITTGLNYSLADGDFRKSAGSALIYFENRPVYGFRPERDRWRQTLPITVAIEDLPMETNRVMPPGRPEHEPVLRHPDVSAYAKAGLDHVNQKLSEVLRPLPVEEIVFKGYRDTEAHLQGTLRMGASPADSVVDPSQVHHRLRNLIVVGTSVFPTCSPANPTLTAAALSLRAAEKAYGGVAA
jgi:choline dehydrogenase-like flavoprotein